jgi:hypothetical protein
MGRPKKHPREWTTEEAIHKLFPQRVVKHLKRAAADAEKKPMPKPNSD